MTQGGVLCEALHLRLALSAIPCEGSSTEAYNRLLWSMTGYEEGLTCELVLSRQEGPRYRQFSVSFSSRLS